MTTILISMLLALAMLVIAWSWIDGGRRPLHTIVEPVQPQDAAALSSGAKR